MHKDYEKTFLLAIKMHEFLQKQGVKIQTHIIGHVQDESVYELIKLKTKNLEDIHIITDPIFTKDVKRLMSYYNVALTIGRGFGEAASKKLLVLGCSLLSEYPVIINSENYEDIRKVNFSARVKVGSDFGIDNNVDLFFDKIKRDKNIAFTYKKYNEDCSTKVLSQKVQNIIEDSKDDNLVTILISLFIISLSEIRHRFLYFLKQQKSN